MGSAYVSKQTVRHRVIEIETRLSRLLLERFLKFGQQYFDLKPLGRNASRLCRLPSRVAKAFTILNRTIISVVSLSLYIAAMTFVWWRLTAVTLVFLSAYYIIFTRLTKNIQSLADKVESVEEKSSSSVLEILSNISLVKQVRTEQKELKAWDDLAKEQREVKIAEWKFLDFVSPLKNLVAILVLLLIFVTVAFMVRSSSADVLPKSIVFFLLVRRCVGAFSNVLKIPEEWASISRHVERFSDLLSNDQKYIVTDGAKLSDPFISEIEFRNLRFSGSV